MLCLEKYFYFAVTLEGRTNYLFISYFIIWTIFPLITIVNVDIIFFVIYMPSLVDTLFWPWDAIKDLETKTVTVITRPGKPNFKPVKPNSNGDQPEWERIPPSTAPPSTTPPGEDFYN